MIKHIVTRGNSVFSFSTKELADAEIAQNGGIYTTLEEADPVPYVDVPESVQRWRIRAVLELWGVQDGVDYIATIEGFIESLPEEHKAGAKNAWLHAADFNPSSPMVQTIAQVVGFSQERLNTLFITAYNLTV